MFASKRADGRPTWKVVYDHILTMTPAVGDVISHDELRKALETTEQRYYYNIVGDVCRRLEKDINRTLVSVRGKGYCFTAGAGQIEKGRGYRSRSRRSLNRAVDIMKTSDYKIMSPEDRTWADRERNAAVALVSIIKQHDDKIIAMAEELRMVSETQMESNLRHEATEEELNRLRARIDELERARRERQDRGT
jgi:predicted secreted Zn-dependent protease